MQLTHETLCEMIPHAGLMCLIDAVDAWDEKSIACISHSHMLENNPLRLNGQLSVIHAIEYGAQSMAIHGALLASRYNQALPPGYLAAARDVKFGTIQRLDTLVLPLQISSQQMISSGGNLMYSFQIHCGDDLVMSARLTVAAQVDI